MQKCEDGEWGRHEGLPRWYAGTAQAWDLANKAAWLQKHFDARKMEADVWKQPFYAAAVIASFAMPFAFLGASAAACLWGIGASALGGIGAGFAGAKATEEAKRIGEKAAWLYRKSWEEKGLDPEEASGLARSAAWRGNGARGAAVAGILAYRGDVGQGHEKFSRMLLKAAEVLASRKRRAAGAEAEAEEEDMLRRVSPSAAAALEADELAFSCSAAPPAELPRRGGPAL